MNASMDWNRFSTNAAARHKQSSPLMYFLAFVCALFIGILIFCYVVTKRSHPVFLDQQGRPVATGSEHSHH